MPSAATKAFTQRICRLQPKKDFTTKATEVTEKRCR